MKKLLLFAIVATLGLQVFAQQRKVTGRVTVSEDGSPLPGVTVLVKGATGSGTTTGANGDYSISVAQTGATLRFSFVGKIPQEVTVGSGNVINIAMKSSTLGLDEVRFDLQGFPEIFCAFIPVLVCKLDLCNP